MKYFSLICLPFIHSAEFVKDGHTDSHDFPPNPMLGSGGPSGMPFGHLRPIGHQRRPTGEIPTKTFTEINSDLRHIYRDFIYEDLPVHLKGFLNKEDYIEFLDDEYFDKTFREMVVETITKVPGKYGQTKAKPMRIGKFTDFYKNEDWYLVNTISEIMEPKIKLPPFLKCGPFPTVIEEVKMWFSYGMTSSHIHKDHEETLLCLLDGRKDIMIFDKNQEKFLREYMVHDDILGYTRLSADSDHINMYTEQKIGRLAWKWATLRAGDCIYIPNNQFHHIRSHGRALAFSYHWQPITLENHGLDDFLDCQAGANATETEKAEFKLPYETVSDFLLKYRANIRGKRYIDLDYYDQDLTYSLFRNDLIGLAYGKGVIDKQDFFKMWQLWAYHNSPEDYMKIAWSKISQDLRKEKCSTSRIKSLSQRDLESLLKLLKKFHLQAIDPIGFRKEHGEL